MCCWNCGDVGEETKKWEVRSLLKKSRQLSGTGAQGRHLGEEVIKVILLGCAALSVVTTVGIVLSLLKETISFFSRVSVVEFLTGTRWTPMFMPQHSAFYRWLPAPSW